MTGGGSLSRRTFLRTSTAVALLSATPLAVIRRAGSARLVSLSRSTFIPLLGKTFRMTGNGTINHVVLDEINDLFPVAQAEDENRFALVFRGPTGAARTDGIKKFHHSNIGAISMFVVPVGMGTKFVHYEAIINRT
jgi:hypothetical protein